MKNPKTNLVMGSIMSILICYIALLVSVSFFSNNSKIYGFVAIICFAVYIGGRLSSLDPKGKNSGPLVVSILTALFLSFGKHYLEMIKENQQSSHLIIFFWVALFLFFATIVYIYIKSEKNEVAGKGFTRGIFLAQMLILWTTLPILLPIFREFMN